MKKYIFTLAIIFALCGCKLERMSNGNFDGNWHMTTIDTLSSSNTTNVSEERIYWAVQGKLLQLRYIGNKSGGYADDQGYYMRFTSSDTEIALTEAYINGWHEDWGEDGGDTPLEDTLQLQRYGVNGLPERFAIEELTGSNMTLKSSKLRLHFVKQ